MRLPGALDVVAHEWTHGVTDYGADLFYRDEPGALNESFSDIMGASVEFYYQTPGSGRQQADWLIAEDITLTAPHYLRSMSDPISVGHPDHYSLVRFIGTDIDNGGIHINSGVPNQAYYLAVAGGTNRVSGLRVQGVGLANRERMERIFYRGFVYFLGVVVDVPRRAGRDDSGRSGAVRQRQRRDEGRDRRLDGGRGLLMRGRWPGSRSSAPSRLPPATLPRRKRGASRPGGMSASRSGHWSPAAP